MSQGQLVILNGLRQISSGLASQLQQYIAGGGNVLIFPSMQADMELYNTFLRGIQVNNYGARFGERREVTQINTRQEVFSDVFEKITDNIDLPFATEGFDLLAYSGAAEEPLLTFQGGRSFLSASTVGSGKVYVCAAPLDTKSTNLPTHSIFVPMVYENGRVGWQQWPSGLHDWQKRFD